SLCMNNSASFTGYQLQVGGTLTLQNTASVGTSSSTPVHDAHIAGGCSVNGSGYHTPCGASDRVYSQVPEDNTTAALTKPPVAMSSWYENAQPGPMHTCTTGSFPGGFDNDTVMNHSRATVDLTPNTAYDCK